MEKVLGELKPNFIIGKVTGLGGLDADGASGERVGFGTSPRNP